MESEVLDLLVTPTRRASTTNAIAIIEVTFVRNFEEPVPNVESDEPPKIPPRPCDFSSCTATRKMRTHEQNEKDNAKYSHFIFLRLLIVCNDRQELLNGK